MAAAFGAAEIVDQLLEGALAMAYGVINWDTWLVFTDGDVRCEGFLS